MRMLVLIKILAILLTGLLAGLFYGYQCSIIKSLGNLSDVNYLSAFQSINKEIQNPVFFLSFMGSIIFLAISTFWSYKIEQTISYYFLFSALVVYVLGVFAITIFGNVPLNEQLANFPISTASQEEISLMRKAFEAPWNNFHTIRTIASILSFFLTILSVYKK